MAQIYLIVGATGTGKTWVARKIIEEFQLNQEASIGLYKYRHNGKIAVIGVYDGSTFEGSDRLSMAVMTSNEEAKKEFERFDYVICEGDRFTNKTFIQQFNPYVIKIKGDGSAGRKLRQSNQTERQIKAIQTRINNTPFDFEVFDSVICLKSLSSELRYGIIQTPKPKYIESKSQNLFDI